jgi:hypothetical protein
MKTLKVFAALAVGVFTLRATQPNGVVAHEWGTFTSVAKADGAPVTWATLAGSNDLPCFVSGLGPTKNELAGLVRMETPVLYFYSPHPATLSVHVSFPHGWITEWYPKARVAADAPFVNGKIGWETVEVTPGANPEFPATKSPSRYFAARDTDSAALRVGDQNEKFLFYRGVGGFQVPVRPKYLSDGKLEIRNAGPDPIPLAIVFENRAGKIGYRVADKIVDSVTVDPPAMTGDLQLLQHTLARDLAELGLHQKEADAMVETWRDSWFEQGTRVLYIYPQQQVDALLPLSIEPKPASTTRVFVGRAEVLSPWTRDTIQAAMTAADVPALKQFGRFLEPFLKQMQTNPETLRTTLLRVQQASTSGKCVD